MWAILQNLSSDIGGSSSMGVGTGVEVALPLFLILWETSFVTHLCLIAFNVGCFGLLRAEFLFLSSIEDPSCVRSGNFWAIDLVLSSRTVMGY